jgi:ubiquinone/menaquinone biosynthesis C-methylase UbiE
MTDQIANLEQAEAWDGRQGEHWVRYADRYDALNQRLTPHLMEAAAIGPAERVLDLGCGCGLTSRLAAHAASSGSVLGMDLSGAMLEEAERRIRAEGLSNVRFEQGDVQVQRFPPGAFDLAISRFGVMFFESPVAAFSNIASALRPDGRFIFLCWQERERNEWVTVTVSAALEHVPPSAPRPEGAPGPFSLAKPERIRQLLTDAGFENLDVSEIAEPVLLGDDADDAADFWQGTGTARLLLDEVDTETERRAIDAVRGALQSHGGPGGIWLGSAAWLVTATRP